MIWKRIIAADVVAATAMHHDDKKLILNRNLGQLRRQLVIYGAGELKRFDRLCGDPRDRLDYKGAIAAQAWVTAWLGAIDSIPLRRELGFNERHHLVAVHFHCTDPDLPEYYSVDDLAKQFGCGHSTIWRMISGDNRPAINWPHGKPGVNDYLVACERRITKMNVDN